MNDENIDLSLDELDEAKEQAEQKLKAKNRFEQLSTQVIEEKKRNEELAKKAEDAERKVLEAEKKAQFLENFSNVTSKYPNASEYREQILEKVSKGYDVQDATIAVLANEGKLGGGSHAPLENVAGGSATLQFTSGEKDITDMSLDEKREALIEADKRGDLEALLRFRN